MQRADQGPVLAGGLVQGPLRRGQVGGGALGIVLAEPDAVLREGQGAADFVVEAVGAGPGPGRAVRAAAAVRGGR
ncbi:hypothetical protein ACFWSF_18020 [Streptomyces sp. NPDC058611]|uniref:hypothetical protein n=1 Tax=unclassified Streptomyces TaxID=2593676 RepID=UPI00364D30D1